MPGDAQRDDAAVGLMGGFFQDLAKKLTERWIVLLLLPAGCSSRSRSLGCAWLGLRLGHAHEVDWTMAPHEVSTFTSAVTRQSGVAQATVIIAVVLAASATGLAV